MAEQHSGLKLGGLIVTPNELQAQHVYIVKLLQEILEQNRRILLLLHDRERYCIPELSAAVTSVSKIADFIDRKVPDKNVPRGTTP